MQLRMITWINQYDLNHYYIHFFGLNESINCVLLGTCEPDEFKKAIEKIGVAIPTQKDLMMLFNYYDTDKSGALDYKEFTQILLGNDSG